MRPCIRCSTRSIPPPRCASSTAAQLPQLARELRAFLHRVGRADRRPPVVEPRHGRADHRAALRVRHAARPHRLGRRATRPTRTRSSPAGASDGRLRMPGGIVGLSRAASESEYDTFGTAHSSARRSRRRSAWRSRRKRKGEERRVVAVIGDGAMTAGMAFEALNNAGATDANLLVILNDNDMSISRAGRRAEQLSRAADVRRASTPRCARGGEKVLQGMPPVLELAKRAEEHVKGMVSPGTLFEEFGFNYIGPIDGHDLDALIAHARRTSASSRARSSCTSSRSKGKGYTLRRGRSGPLPRRRRSSTRRTASCRRPAGEADLHAGLRRLAVRHGGARRAPGRHHAGDARRLGPGALLAGISRALLRRRHRRAARGDLRRRPRLRGHEAGGRDLLDLPAARLRPADPRRRAAEPAGGVRDRPRRPGRRRRRDAHRRVRPVATCAASRT